MLFHWKELPLSADERVLAEGTYLKARGKRNRGEPSLERRMLSGGIQEGRQRYD